MLLTVYGFHLRQGIDLLSGISRMTAVIVPTTPCCMEDHLAGGTSLPVITRLRFGMVKMNATTDEAVILASES